MNTEAVEKSLNGDNQFKNSLIPQRNKFLLDECKDAAKRMGQFNVNAEVFTLAFEGLRDEIISLYSFYSLEEISSVLLLGAKGELGDNVSISFRTFVSWFKEYHNNYRKNLIKQIKPNLNIKQISSVKSEVPFTKDDAISHLNEVLDDYKIGGNIYGFSYNIFEKYGLTNLYSDNKDSYDSRGKTVVRERNNMSISSYMRKAAIGEDEIENAGKIEALKDFLDSEIKNK